MRQFLARGKPVGLIFLCLAIVWLGSQPFQTAAQAPTDLVLTASAGFNGFYKDSQWVPVRVVLENSGPGIEGEVVAQLADSGLQAYPYVFPVTLPSISRKVVTLFIFPSGYASSVKVSFVSQGKTTVEVSVNLNQLSINDSLTGVVAANPSAYNVFSSLDPFNGTASVVELELDNLPERVQGLAALDTLIFSGIDTGNLSDRQRSAIAEWTAWGGRLIITGGPEWLKTSKGFQSTDLLPVAPDKAITLSGETLQATLGQIQTFAGDGENIEPTADRMIISTGSLMPQAEVLASIPDLNNLPLVSSRAYGSGQVLFVAFDPSLPPFRNWNRAENFYRNLTAYPLPNPTWKKGFLDWSMAQQAAQTLPSLELPSVLLICGFLAIYVGTIGPANYFLLRKLKRRELGWITIPILVVSFSILVFLTGSLSRGQKPVLHRLAIVQAWQGTTQARVDGVIGLYSPNRSTYSVSTDFPTVLNGLPSFSMLSNTVRSVNQIGDEFQLTGLQVDVGGVIPFAFQTSVPAPSFGDSLSLNIDETGAVLTGEITNLNNLELQDAILLSLTNVINLGDISANKTIAVNQQLDISQTGNAITAPAGVKPMPGIAIPIQTYSPVNIIEQILGTYDYYQDRETYRKYSLLVAAMSYQPAVQQTNEIYLIGWSSQPLAEISLEDKLAEIEDLSLYIIAFKPEVNFEGDRWTLTPGFFQWSSLEPLRTEVTPYNVYLYSPTTYGLVFSPRQALSFSRVDSLTFHLKNPSQSGSVIGVIFYLWNYEIQDWVRLDDVVWGDNEIADPEQFIPTRPGSDEQGSYQPGTIRLRVESSSSYLEISASDFTLVVER